MMMNMLARHLALRVPRSLVLPIQRSTRGMAAAAAVKQKSRTEVDFKELENLRQEGEVSLIDVRQPCELHDYGEIPGSVHIPLTGLKTALQMSEKDWNILFQLSKPQKRDDNIVFYARGPNCSRAAVEIAHRLGFKGSRQYTGGWEDYCSKSGIPLKKKNQPPEDPTNGGHDGYDPFAPRSPKAYGSHDLFGA